MDQYEVIRNLNNEINTTKESCTKALNEVNYYYWPIIAKLKKDKKNRIWYFTMVCCAIFAAMVWMIFTEYEERMIILIASSFLFILLAITGFRMIRTIKIYNETDRIWQKALVEPTKQQNIIKDKCEEAIKLMTEMINDQNEINKIGKSYDDILEYYNNWVELH